jgi:hypothetical protein
VEEELRARVVRVDIQVIDARRIEGGGAPDETMYLIALRQEKLSEVGTVLSGDAGDEGALGQGLLRS